jgi:predicted nucleic acid-binding protein
MTSSTLADEYVTDTMALILHLENRRSSETVKAIFDSADEGKTTIHIPAMVFAEILYLTERRRIELDLIELEKHLKKFPNYRESPMSLEIVKNGLHIIDIPELHDRLIASTANHLKLKLITNDLRIQASKFVDTIW